MSELILGIETSGFEGSIALRHNGRTLEACTLERRRHAQTLIAQVQSLLSRHSLAAADVTTVAVSHGPGSFTGLRVGVVFAKTFAFATRCRLVAVDTLECVAAATPPEFGHVSVIADAQREQLFVGEYDLTGDTAHRLAPIRIVDIDAFCRDSESHGTPSRAVSGPGLSRVVDLLAESVNVVCTELRLPNAGHVACIGERLAACGTFADPSTLEPFYIRRSSAEDKRDAQQRVADSTDS